MPICRRVFLPDLPRATAARDVLKIVSAGLEGRFMSGDEGEKFDPRSIRRVATARLRGMGFQPMVRVLTHTAQPFSNRSSESHSPEFR